MITKEQIKEALDAVKEYCGKYSVCSDCKLYDGICGGARNGTRFPQGWDAKDIEKAAEVVTDERN